jgi:hypothetical protein
LEHTLYLEGREAETNWTLAWKPSYDHIWRFMCHPKGMGQLTCWCVRGTCQTICFLIIYMLSQLPNNPSHNQIITKIPKWKDAKCPKPKL